MPDSAPVCWAIVPVKAPGEGKSRLAGVLRAHERQALVEAMLDRVIAAAEGCEAIARVCIVGPSDHGLDDRVTLLREGGGGLNGALSTAVERLVDDILAPSRPDRLIVVAGDLPQIDVRDFAMLADVRANAIGIAPDRHGTGTNALSVPLSAAPRFRFRFGPGSYALHREGAHRLGYTVDTMLSDGLEKDIDEPADLADAKGCLQGAS